MPDLDSFSVAIAERKVNCFIQFQFWRLETLKKRAESVSSQILAVLSHARRWTGGRDTGNGKRGGTMRGSEWNG